VMTQVDLGLTSVSRFDLADPVISVNDVNQKPGASHCAGRVARRRRPVLATVPPASAVVAAGAKEWAARKASVGLKEVWSGWAAVEEGTRRGSRGGGRGGPAAD
jgi:hypothetical protein